MLQKGLKRERIYFDNAASAPLNKVFAEHLPAFRHRYGNPSSSHKEGRVLRGFIETARKQCAEALGCSAKEIFFTSGASEANSWAHQIWPLQYDIRAHNSLKIGNNRQTLYYAASMINNETGSLDYLNYRHIAPSQLFLDLTSAVGHHEIDLEEMKHVVGASLSGHKFGALPGVGLLYVRKDQQKRMKPLIHGHQEQGLRGGTENTLGIISLGIAIEDVTNNLYDNRRHIYKMAKHLSKGLNKCVKKVRYFYGNHIVNITFNNLHGDSAVLILDNEGVAVSTGSACSSNFDSLSTSLISEGYSEDEAARTIRVSLGSQNTIKECKEFVRILKKIIDIYDN